MRFVDPNYPLSELTRDVIAGFYRSYDAFGFGFLESVYRNALSVELRRSLFFRQRFQRRVSGSSGPTASKAHRNPDISEEADYAILT